MITIMAALATHLMAALAQIIHIGVHHQRPSDHGVLATQVNLSVLLFHVPTRSAIGITHRWI